MTQAKCLKCGGSATADTFEQAKNLINHAVGLSRGIKCGDNYNAVQEIKSEVVTKKKPETLKQKETETPITESKTEPKSDTKEKKTNRKSKN